MRSDEVNNVNAHLTVKNDAFFAENKPTSLKPMRLIAISNFLSISLKADRRYTLLFGHNERFMIPRRTNIFRKDNVSQFRNCY